MEKNLTIYEIKVSFLSLKENHKEITDGSIFEDKNYFIEIKGTDINKIVRMINSEISDLSDSRVYFSPMVHAYSANSIDGILFFDLEETERVDELSCKMINKVIKSIEKKRGF